MSTGYGRIRVCEGRERREVSSICCAGFVVEHDLLIHPDRIEAISRDVRVMAVGKCPCNTISRV